MKPISVKQYRTIQDHCRAERLKRGESLRFVANAVDGIEDFSHLRKFEIGLSRFRFETLLNLLRYYGYDFEIVKQTQNVKEKTKGSKDEKIIAY